MSLMFGVLWFLWILSVCIGNENILTEKKNLQQDSSVVYNDLLLKKKKKKKCMLNE